MHGKITFLDLETFTAWLVEWAGKSTAVFEAYQHPSRPGCWVVEFKGGI